MRPLALLSSLVLCLATGAGAFYVRSSSPSSWPMKATELHSVALQRQGLDRLRAEIARIASGDETRAREVEGVVLGYAQILQAERELLDEASARCGVAVVQSGATWVRR